jgi:hypothetical protein
MALQESVVDAVSNANFKALAESGVHFNNLIIENAIASARNMSAIREKSVARSLERFDVTNDDEGVNASVLNATVMGYAQTIAKIAQTTPPVTHP